MVEVAVERIEERPDEYLFRVDVRGADGTRTRHLVTVKHDHHQAVTRGNVPHHVLVEAAFRFLLEREPKEMIFRSFDLREIGDYFHEFDTVMQRRFAPDASREPDQDPPPGIH